MRRLPTAFVGLVLLGAVTAAPVAASQTERGDPTLPNCMGQTTAFETHVLVDQFGAPRPGIGNFAKAWGYFYDIDFSVQDLKAATRLKDCTPIP